MVFMEHICDKPAQSLIGGVHHTAQSLDIIYALIRRVTRDAALGDFERKRTGVYYEEVSLSVLYKVRGKALHPCPTVRLSHHPRDSPACI